MPSNGFLGLVQALGGGDVVSGFLVILLAALGIAAIVAVGLAFRPKPTKPETPKKQERPKPQGRLDAFSRLAKELGLDKVLIRELEHMLYDGLEKGKVRLSLASDDCPGYVVLDVPSRRFMCVYQGRAWPLEGREAGETIELEEEARPARGGA